VFLDFPDFTAKWMEMLVESDPKLARAAVLWDPLTGPVASASICKLSAISGDDNITMAPAPCWRAIEQAASKSVNPTGNARDVHRIPDEAIQPARSQRQATTARIEVG
jgi:hypothetical protein